MARRRKDYRPARTMFGPFKAVRANSVDMYVPEFWAQESLIILEENMVAANLVHRDFENVVAKVGDTVNTRRPAEFTAKRKTSADNVTKQDASATNVAVVLNQHVHTSFEIKDGEESTSLKSLVEEFMKPAVLAQVRLVDQVILGQYPKFIHNRGGKLGTGATEDYLIDMRQVMEENKAPDVSRNLILTPASQASLLKRGIFNQAQQSGSSATLRKGQLGEAFGFSNWSCQNMASIAAGNTVVTGAINNASGYSATTTSITVDGITGALPVNSWFTVAGDMTPQRIVSVTNTLGNTTGITFWPGLRYDVVDNAVITNYTPGAVNAGSGYAVGYAKEITIDGFTVAPRVGQMISFGTSTSNDQSVNPYYTVIQVNGLTGITLDRPLDVALADNTAVNIGPAGNYNLAFNRNAISFVIRPLALPQSNVRAAVINVNGLSMRVVITYNGESQAHLVTLDFLCGVKVLDTLQGAVLLG